MSTSLHDSYVRIRRVRGLTVFDRVGKPIREFLLRSQKIRLHKLDHAVVFVQSVLEGRSRQNNAALRTDPVHRFGEGCRFIFQHVPFVANNQVRPRIHESTLESFPNGFGIL